jgi:hypothetical protein
MKIISYIAKVWKRLLFFLALVLIGAILTIPVLISFLIWVFTAKGLYWINRFLEIVLMNEKK